MIQDCQFCVLGIYMFCPTTSNWFISSNGNPWHLFTVWLCLASRQTGVQRASCSGDRNVVWNTLPLVCFSLGGQNTAQPEHYKMNNEYWTLQSAHTEHWILNIAHCTHWTHCKHCTLHMVHCTLNTVFTEKPDWNTAVQCTPVIFVGRMKQLPGDS